MVGMSLLQGFFCLLIIMFYSFMVRKLFVFVRGGCATENPDSPMNQDILTSGTIYLVVLKVRLSLSYFFLIESKGKDPSDF